MAAAMALFISLGWLLRGFGADEQVNNNSQVINDKNAASIGNKSIYSPSVDGKKTNLRLESENVSLLLQKRLESTSSWLQQKSDYRYSVQLMLLDESRMTALDAFLLKMKKQGLIENTYVYQVSKDGQLFYGVLYGRFKQYSNAIRSLAKVRRQVKLRNPFIRDMENISSEYI